MHIKILCLVMSFSFSAAWAQKIADEDREITFSSPDDNLRVVTTKFSDKKLLSKLRKKNCRKYNNKMISYYGNIYKVDSCKRRLIEDADLLFKITKRKTKIYPVDAEVVASLEEGKAKEYLGKDKPKTCRQLNGSYITFSDVDVYWVQGCRKRRFSNWDSFVDHHRKRFGSKELKINSLRWEEFLAIKDGKEMNTPKVKTLPKMMYEEEVDVIPLGEACKGIEGKVVSYYSKLYKIQKCRKRYLDPGKYLATNRKKRRIFKEITSEQWISLPDGRPVY